MTLALIGTAVYLLFLLFAVALCKSAARADEAMERAAAKQRHPSNWSA